MSNNFCSRLYWYGISIMKPAYFWNIFSNKVGNTENNFCFAFINSFPKDKKIRNRKSKWARLLFFCQLIAISLQVFLSRKTFSRLLYCSVLFSFSLSSMPYVIHSLLVVKYKYIWWPSLKMSWSVNSQLVKQDLNFLYFGTDLDRLICNFHYMVGTVWKFNN